MSEQALNEQDPQPAETQPDPLEELRREKDSLQDRLLRTAAEFDNYRKRVERERRELADYMKADVLAEILPILDNFERALQAPSPEGDGLRKGVELIHKQMLDFLRKRGVTPIEALGRSKRSERTSIRISTRPSSTRPVPRTARAKSSRNYSAATCWAINFCDPPW